MKVMKSLLGAGVLLSGAALVLLGLPTSAVDYQGSVKVRFSFDETVMITLSDDILLIDDLSPGTSAYSNMISVDVLTNSTCGYTLSAMVGGIGQTVASNALYNAATQTSFNSLASSASATLASFQDNDWGYTTASTINDSTAYSGLSYNIGKVINQTVSYDGAAADGYAGTNSTSFTIGAKASASQAYGDYSNVITFAVVSNPVPRIYMQDISPSTLASLMLDVGDKTTLYDIRDDKPYTVAKLADGNYWMLDNLALDITNTSVKNAMYSSTNSNYDTKTNASNTTLGYLFNGGGTTSDKYATAAVTNWTSSYSYSRPMIAVDSTTSGACAEAAYCVHSDLSWSYNDEIPATINDVTSIAQGKIGIYYNYCAASAGSYCYGNGTNAGTSVDNPTSAIDAPEDLCPSGWRMPTGGAIGTAGTTTDGGGEYQYLYNQYSGTSPNQYTAFQTALDTPLSGMFWSGKAYSQGSGGIFWSSTRDGNGYMYALIVGTSLVYPDDYYNSRIRGFSIRCIATPENYMQKVSSSKLASLMPNTGDTATLYDKRDGTAYSVAKLADGKYWMTSNLNLAGGTKLDSAGSNVPDGYTQSDPYYTLPATTSISSGTSVQSGQFSDDAGQYVFNTNNNTTTCNSNTPCNSYYSWLVATAGGKDSSGNAVTTDGYNTAYSICPKGWRLPTSTTSNASATANNNWKTGDWYALATAYGANLESSYYENAATFYNNAGPNTTPNFLLAGYYYSYSFLYGGSNGYYWSATSGSSTSAYNLRFSSGKVSSADSYFRRVGFSVRCVFGD